ncbi:histidine phosphatase family protein [Paenibacillus hodogayensis]|uniref:Histidine phosphatase family protein n=1 Tax=Paenibacillus hodogayensis TaxID=279208 RepID=A0ABV5W2N0_9BACL
MKIYLIRHAEPDYPNRTITAAGHREAQALAEHLQLLGVDRIYSSPVERAVHTMQYTAALLGVSPTIEPWTRELNWQTPDAGGQPMAAWNIPGETVRAALPFPGRDTWAQYAPYGDYARDYETICSASDAFLERLGYVREEGRYRIAAPSRDAVAVFCHLGFGLTWLSHLLELPFPLVWSAFWLAPSSVTTIVFEERSEQWVVPRCTGLGCVAHLHKAGLPVSTMGLLANHD